MLGRPAQLGARAGAAGVLLLLSGCAPALRQGPTGVQRAVEGAPVTTAAPATRAAEPVPPPEPLTLPDTDDGVFHEVLPGQTLWRIARTYGIPVETLARENRLEDPTRLEVGARLFVPGARQPLEVPPLEPSPAELLGNGSLTWPVTGGTVLSHFGAPRRGRRHQGLDIGGRHGQPVLAIAPGRVVYSGSGMRGYGKTVILDHGDGLRSLYAHNSRLLVRVGQAVEQGTAIARVGRSGNATANHCHLEIRRDDVPVDPWAVLRAASDAGGAGDRR